MYWRLAFPASTLLMLVGGSAVKVAPCAGGAGRPTSSGLMATVSQPQVSIANVPSPVQFSGLVPGYNGGLYVVNAQVPESVPSGAQPLVLTINGVSSNSVKVAIQ